MTPSTLILSLAPAVALVLLALTGCSLDVPSTPILSIDPVASFDVPTAAPATRMQ